MTTPGPTPPRPDREKCSKCSHNVYTQGLCWAHFQRVCQEKANRPVEHIEKNVSDLLSPRRVRTECGRIVFREQIAPGLIDATCKSCLRSIPRLHRNVAQNSAALGIGPKPGPKQAPDWPKETRFG